MCTKESAYRRAEKVYKAYADGRNEATLLHDVLDFKSPSVHVSRIIEQPRPACAQWLHAAAIFSVRGAPGFRFIRGALSADRQLEVAYAALTEWCEADNESNLNAHGRTRSLWAEHLSNPKSSLLTKLSWLTLGHHYQWTERTYDPARVSPFPPQLAVLASELAQACGETMVAEAAIINFYSARSTMGGHKDDAEPCQAAPIISISIGLPAIFLLGGHTKDEPPIALLVRSGDVVVQAGESRGYYHGVPRILSASPPRELLDACSSSNMVGVAEWLQTHRLNANVRQALPTLSLMPLWTAQRMHWAQPRTYVANSL